MKRECGDALEWLIQFIGDWHLLSNYQSVLMNLYYDATLKELKRTHHFLVQAWEAVLLYRQMFQF